MTRIQKKLNFILICPSINIWIKQRVQHFLWSTYHPAFLRTISSSIGCIGDYSAASLVGYIGACAVVVVSIFCTCGYVAVVAPSIGSA